PRTGRTGPGRSPRIQVPGLSLEDLLAVPPEVSRSRPPLGPLRRPHGCAVIAKEHLVEARLTVRLVGDEQDALLVDREGAQVENLVVENAESQPVALLGRATGLVPLDVGRIQRNGDRAQPDVEATDRAAPLVGRQHLLTELRVALAVNNRGRERQPNG